MMDARIIFKDATDDVIVNDLQEVRVGGSEVCEPYSTLKLSPGVMCAFVGIDKTILVCADVIHHIEISAAAPDF